jgi:preprotein translocase subunit SecY
MANPGGTTSARMRDPRRWAVTLGGLAVYGLGSRLWLPGLDPGAVAGLTVPAPPAALSIFAVGVRPILFGLAFVEMARLVLPPLARWAAGGHGRSELLWRTARLFALALAASQAMGIARAVEGLDGAAPSPGPMFRLGVVVAIVGATAFLIWLARVMTERGVGDGLLILFAAPFVARLLYDAATGVEIVRTGLQPDWGPLALAALVVAPLALLIVATRTTGADNRLDIWSPLIGTLVFQWLIVFFHLDDQDAPLTAVWLLILIAAQAGLIWLFAAWRGRAQRADAVPLGCEILVCGGALALSPGVGGPMTGPWIILCVAAALSVANGKAQADGGLSGPTPTA